MNYFSHAQPLYETSFVTMCTFVGCLHFYRLYDTRNYNNENSRFFKYLTKHFNIKYVKCSRRIKYPRFTFLDISDYYAISFIKFYFDEIKTKN